MYKYKRFDVIQWIKEPETRAVIVSYNEKGDYYYRFLTGKLKTRIGSLRSVYLENDTRLYALHQFNDIWNNLNV